MARFYSNENFPRQAVEELRRLGHDVLTSFEAGNANRSVPDGEVLDFAGSQDRILLTQNRLHFLRLHQRKAAVHAGIVICTYDPDFLRLAAQIHAVVGGGADLADALVRINRPRT